DRALPGEADEDHQRDADDRIDEDKNELALQIAADKIGRCRQHGEKKPIGPPMPAMLEELDVLLVVGLEDEPHGRAAPQCPDSEARHTSLLVSGANFGIKRDAETMILLA